MRKQFVVFVLRWVLNSLGLWIAVQLFGTGYTEGTTAGAGGFLVAGLIFSIINSIVRPIAIIVSLPAILLTLGLFSIIVNGLMVYISLQLAPGIHMAFWHSVATGMVLSLVNYIVSSALELQYVRRQEEKE